MARSFKTQLAGQIGEHLVVAELGRLDIVATPFSGNVPDIDVLAYKDGKSVPIQVKANRIGDISDKSSEFAERGFCLECGSSLVQRALKDDCVSLASGCFDHSENFPPREHGGIESQVSWLKVDDDLPRKTTNEHMGYTVDD